MNSNSIEFGLHSYRAVKSAKIKIDGITVISGENGSGKSTISRSLYYLINTMCAFDTLVLSEAKTDILSRLDQYNAIIRQGSDISQVGINGEGPLLSSIKNASIIEELRTATSEALTTYKELLYPFFTENNPRTKRFLQFLGMDSSSNSIESISKHIENTAQTCDTIIKGADAGIKSKRTEILMKYVGKYGSDLNNIDKSNVRLIENGEELISDDKFVPPISLSSAIYVDTPMAINANFNISNIYWNQLGKLMLKKPKPYELPSNVIEYCDEIRKEILHGDVINVDQKFSNRSRLAFEREDGLKIALENMATGFKSFAYIHRLVSNGNLNANTLLIIDEPEAHLHPQWIVEMARILIELNKNIGVRILITSHSTDMVLALKSISEKQNRLDKIRFYLAEHAGQFTYDYRDLGTDIEPIFECFNKSLEKIEKYGGNSDL